VKSYRVAQGVLHNPKSDRRTTQGVFHIAEGGLPIPADKIAVPTNCFAALLEAALNPPADVLTLPYMANEPERPGLFVSLMLRPLVCPAVGSQPEKTMEIRFFVPGSLVSNLDFVESIFGNAGDPYLPENDAALDTEHWTGHSGCVILAPHLPLLRKKDLGLPHIAQATPRQKRDGMCWKEESETYNNGSAFKVACRDARGVMVTIIADNYFGYCKKEVKTQIGYAANLYGLALEEHAGGALAFPSYVLGLEFTSDPRLRLKPASFEEAMRLLADVVEMKPEGYAVDKRHPDVLYLPDCARFDAPGGFVEWERGARPSRISLRANEVYVLPSGYRVRLEKHWNTSAWRLVGTRPDATLCHKPATVSGGGKSEISKSISGVLLDGPIFVRRFQEDMDAVAEILQRDFSGIYRNPRQSQRAARPLLSPERSLGSVIRLFTTSDEYTDEHNRWVRELPQTIRQLVLTVKRYYRPEWGGDWREHFSVDRINGYLGHELRFDRQKLIANYLRVGFDPDGSWRIHKLRGDFHPSEKVQMEDDITASVVVPREAVPHLDEGVRNPSVAMVANCENFLFQRPDDAVHRGADAQAEADIAGPGVFLSNFEPLDRQAARALVDHVVEFESYTEPMKRLLAGVAAQDGAGYVVSSAHPRLVNGKPSKNQRYLQRRPDLANPLETYLAEVSTRLHRRIPPCEPVYYPVDAMLPGRRNNPPDRKLGVAPLAVYNPIHYQELPELFMELISSLTGKSPSTTGFGSEGALTKGPFNALLPIYDLNAAFVGLALSGYGVFTTSAGYIGPRYRVDHDISMLVPEIWCRMSPEERDPAFLIAHGCLEKLDDFEHEGRAVLAGRLGYRMTEKFVDMFFGRVFETPDMVFTDEWLRPELQGMGVFAEGVGAIVASQRRVALNYFEDGSVEVACPPLKALLHVMAHGGYEGMTLADTRLRSQFTREAVLASGWYAERLRARQRKAAELWTRHLEALEDFRTSGLIVPRELQLEDRIAAARERAAAVASPDYLQVLAGSIGADPAL
jgi:hypothetical protein